VLPFAAVRSLFVFPLVAALAASACSGAEPAKPAPMGQLPNAVTTAQPEWLPFSIRAGEQVAADPREHHLADLRKLTSGGENAEAYWSPDGRSLIFQATREGDACDQMYVLDLGTGETRRVSSGKGRTTCGFFFYPTGDRILYSSTEATGPGCPPKPDRSQGYVWPLDPHDIYAAKPDGSAVVPLIAGPGYDAEATMSFDGKRLVFTSTRDGDLELYTAKSDGSDVRRITREPGYDGGAFFSPDGTRLVWRASRPTGEALDRYRAMLARGLIQPTHLEIMVADASGGRAHAITNNGRENFAPSFLPDSRRVIFASNVAANAASGGPPNFDLYVIDPEGPLTLTGGPALRSA